MQYDLGKEYYSLYGGFYSKCVYLGVINDNETSPSVLLAHFKNKKWNAINYPYMNEIGLGETKEEAKVTYGNLREKWFKNFYPSIQEAKKENLKLLFKYGFKEDLKDEASLDFYNDKSKTKTVAMENNKTLIKAQLTADVVNKWLKNKTFFTKNDMIQGLKNEDYIYYVDKIPTYLIKKGKLITHHFEKRLRYLQKKDSEAINYNIFLSMISDNRKYHNNLNNDKKSPKKRLTNKDIEERAIIIKDALNVIFDDKETRYTSVEIRQFLTEFKAPYYSMILNQLVSFEIVKKDEKKFFIPKQNTPINTQTCIKIVNGINKKYLEYDFKRKNECLNKISDEVKLEVIRLKEQGFSCNKIASEIKIRKSTVTKILEKEEVPSITKALKKASSIPLNDYSHSDIEKGNKENTLKTINPTIGQLYYAINRFVMDHPAGFDLYEAIDNAIEDKKGLQIFPLNEYSDDDLENECAKRNIKTRISQYKAHELVDELRRKGVEVKATKTIEY